MLSLKCLNWKQAQKKVNHYRETKTKGEKGKLFRSFSCQKSLEKSLLVERKACCRVVNAVLSRLKLIRLISRMKMFKMSTKCILPKCSWCQWANFPNKSKLFLLSYFQKEILIFSYFTSTLSYPMFVLQEFYIKQEIYYTSQKKIPRKGQFLKKNETILNFSE